MKKNIFSGWVFINKLHDIYKCRNVIQTSLIPRKIIYNCILPNFCSFLLTLKVVKKIIIDANVNIVARFFCSCRFCRDGLMLLQGVLACLCVLYVTDYGYHPWHQFSAVMPGAKMSWLLSIGRLVSKTDNVMHLAHLVKQVSVDVVGWSSCGQSHQRQRHPMWSRETSINFCVKITTGKITTGRI